MQVISKVDIFTADFLYNLLFVQFVMFVVIDTAILLVLEITR